MKLKILHVNDVHSRFEGLARIASAIEDLRDENTLVLDAGDNADFARLETEGTNGRISSALLNKMRFTARVFGNNEGFAGKENGRIISESSDFPSVTCNMYDLGGQKLDFLADAATLTVSGVRIMIIGATAPANDFYHLFGIHVKDPEEEIRRVLAEHDEALYDLLILLSHLGLTADRVLASKPLNIQVIIGGHSHTKLEKPLVENQTIICQAGHLGEYLGELTLDFDDADRHIRSFEGRLVPAQGYPQHPEMTELIKYHSRLADENLSVKLYSINTSLDHSLTEENAIGNLLADALRDMLKTEIGLINSGVINSGVRRGPITRKLLHGLCPSPLNPTYVELKGVDILEALEKSLRKEYQLSNGRGPGFRGEFLGNIQVSSNVRVTLHKDQDIPRRIKSVAIDGKQLEPERWYTVGTSDYLQRGTGYEDLARNRRERYRPEFLRDVFEQYLKTDSFLELSSKRRFTIEEQQQGIEH